MTMAKAREYSWVNEISKTDKELLKNAKISSFLRVLSRNTNKKTAEKIVELILDWKIEVDKLDKIVNIILSKNISEKVSKEVLNILSYPNLENLLLYNLLQKEDVNLEIYKLFLNIFYNKKIIEI